MNPSVPDAVLVRASTGLGDPSLGPQPGAGAWHSLPPAAEAGLMTYARNKALGSYGERIAAEHLEALGMVVLARNWTCKFGEIDIVARDGSTLVICEVKTRTSNHHGGPFEAITGHKATRLRRLAMHWLEVHDVQPPSLRIDIVSVVVPPRGAPVVDRIAGVA